MVRILHAYPPIYDRIVATIGTPPGSAIYAWGDAIYVPDGRHVPDDVIAHESVHLDRQAAVGGPEAWWDRYLADPEYRVAEELVAYRAQFAHFCRTVGDRNARARFRAAIAGTLAGPMYGRVIPFADAYAAIGRPA